VAGLCSDLIVLTHYVGYSSTLKFTYFTVMSGTFVSFYVMMCDILYQKLFANLYIHSTMFCRPKLLPYILLHHMVWCYCWILYRMIEVCAVRSTLSEFSQLHGMIMYCSQVELCSMAGGTASYIVELNPSEIHMLFGLVILLFDSPCVQQHAELSNQ
jgi:hypothetical protein